MVTASDTSRVVPMQAGPMYSAGDPSTIPDGQTRSMRNYLMRPNRFDGRPPFVYDSLMSVANFLRWEDNTNQVTRTLAIDASQNLRTKNTNGTGYTATVITGTPSGRLTDFTNFMGQVYSLFDNGAGLPTAAAVYDGAVASSSPFNTPITARTITAFIERLFLAYPRVTITPQHSTNSTVFQIAYDWTAPGLGTTWLPTALTVSNVTQASGVVVGRLTPTSLAASACSIYFVDSIGVGVAYEGAATYAASANEQYFTWRFEARGVDPSYAVPITIELMYLSTIRRSQAYVVGDLRTVGVAGNGYRYRCRIAGTTAVGAPAFGTTIDGDTVDGGVTWRNEGSDIAGATEDFVPSVSTSSTFTTYFVQARIPPTPAGGFITPRLKLYNSISTALTVLAPIEISLKDGLADGDARKQNHGTQITLGDYYYPFFNCETATSATVNIDAIVWSEIDQPKRILAKNNFTLPEVAGLPTAAIVVGGRYIVFKRRGLWVFKRTSDKNIPILPERPANVEVGCIGPRALDVFQDTVYFIGENGIYRMKASSSVFGQVEDPEEIGGPAMREEIMSKGSNWVESQATYNMPFLVVEHSNQEVWIYTQKSKIYVYHIPTGGWSYIDFTGISPEVRTMFYDYGGQRMVVAFGGFGATRLDDSSGTLDSIDNSVTTYNVTNDIIFKPLELYAPRFEAALEEIGVFHNAQFVSGTLSVAYSLDRGATWTTPAGYPATISLSSPRVPMPVGTLGPSVMVKLTRVGPGGSPNWSFSKADAKLKMLRGELPYANAT